MTPLLAAFTKLASIRKAVANALDDEFGRRGQRPLQNFPAEDVGQYFAGVAAALATLRGELPLLYADFLLPSGDPEVEMGEGRERWFSRSQILRLSRDIDQVFEVRADSELAPPEREEPRRVFISHGRAQDWRAVQAYIEKDIGLRTLELAQEVNAGRTILAKLLESAEQCDSAVIVMTGDDLDVDGKARARENVLHEIGSSKRSMGLAASASSTRTALTSRATSMACLHALPERRGGCDVRSAVPRT